MISGGGKEGDREELGEYSFSNHCSSKDKRRFPKDTTLKQEKVYEKSTEGKKNSHIHASPLRMTLNGTSQGKREGRIS